MAKGRAWTSSCAPFLPLLFLISVIAPSTEQVNTVLTLLSLIDGSPLCAVDPPSRVVPLPTAWDYPVTSPIDTQTPSCVPEVLKCAWICSQDRNCTSCNYNQVLRRCELYYYRPLNYVMNTTCTHYRSKDFNGVCPTDQVVVDGVHPMNLARKMVPAECCQFPFTYNGQLYHRCAQNASNATDIGCLVGNRTWVSCLLPADYSVTYSIVNLTIPTFGGSTPVISINGWMVILHRFNGSLNFLRNWTDYRTGFGDPLTGGEYWLGLEAIHRVTFNGLYRLRIELQTLVEGRWFSAEYASFLIDTEQTNYTLQVAGYCGDAGNGLEWTGITGTLQNGMQFSTVDADNDKIDGVNCAAYVGGGAFWWNTCGYSCLTSPYGSTYYYWHPLTDLNLSGSYQLKASRMMIKLP